MQVQPLAGGVGGDQDALGAAAEARDDVRSFLAIQTAVKNRGGHTKRIAQVKRRVAILGEDQRALDRPSKQPPDDGNLGFVAGSASPSGMMLEVTLRNASGAAIGTRTFTIPGNGFEHVQFSSSLLSNQSFDEGSATFRIVSGDGSVAPYASVIDNLSSGGFFIGRQFAPNAPFASGATTFRILFDQMRNTR